MIISIDPQIRLFIKIKQRGILMKESLQFKLLQKKSSKTQGENQKPVSSSEELEQYESFRQHYSYSVFKKEKIHADELDKHKIMINSTFCGSPHQKWKKEKEPQIFFSILQTQFHGLQYIYEVIVGPFRLKILVLNLLRQSDGLEDDVNIEQLGSGSYGTVSEIKLKNGKSYATKKIPFQFKVHPEEGFDYEESKNEQVHLRRCLKQFCFYKILSLVGIGPQIVNEGYDLICFNNCIEFKMQLCQPITNDFRYHNANVNLESCKKSLSSKLSFLHSMNMVHRDIKPQNILFSQNSKEFVFGDFGMVTLLGEQYWQKTHTRFMGTPNFCGEEMKALLDGGSGYVNLYLNDYLSLKLTLNFFTQNSTNQNSRISRNSMSYNQFEEQFEFESGSLGVESGEREESEFVVTDPSPVQTRNSLATLPTAHSLTPKRYASLVNHYQSSIIFNLCRQMQTRIIVPTEDITAKIEKEYQQHENSQVLSNLYIDIYDLFQKKESAEQCIREWKNSSRHYGPEHEITLTYLDNVKSKTSAQAVDDILNKIKFKLINMRRSLVENLMEMQMYNQLKNIRMFIFSFISYLRNLCSISNNSIQTIDEEVYILKTFIHSVFMVYNNNELHTLAKLFWKYFQACPLKKDANMLQSITLSFCHQKLKSLHQLDSTCRIKYLILKLEEIGALELSQTWMKNEFISLSQTIQNEEDNCILLFLYMVIRYLPLRKKGPIGLQLENIIIKLRLMVDKLIQKKSQENYKPILRRYYYFKIELLYQFREDILAREQCKAILKSELFEKSNLDNQGITTKIQIMFILATLQAESGNYSESTNSLNQCLELIQTSNSSLSNPKIVYNIINNKIYILFNQKQYDAAIKEAEGLIQFLQKANFHGKEHKTIMTIYYCMIAVTCKYKQTASLELGKDLSEEVQIYLRQKIKSLLTQFCRYYEKYPQSWITYSSYYPILFQVRETDQLQLFFRECAIKMIKSNPYFMAVLFYQYAGENYEVAKYYISMKNHQLKGMKFLKNCILTKLSWWYPSQFRDLDFQIVHIYSQCLISNQSNRAAIRFLNKIIKYIPEEFQQTKVKCCEVLIKAYERVGGHKENMYYELTKNKSKKLKQRNFLSVLRCTSKNHFQKKMMEKQLKKVFGFDVKTVVTGGKMLDKKF